jgi:hypothetical protein
MSSRPVIGSPPSATSSETSVPNECATTAWMGSNARPTASVARAHSMRLVVRPGDKPCAGQSNSTTRKPARRIGSAKAVMNAASLVQPWTTSTVPRLTSVSGSKTNACTSPAGVQMRCHSAWRRWKRARSDRTACSGLRRSESTGVEKRRKAMSPASCGGSRPRSG